MVERGVGFAGLCHVAEGRMVPSTPVVFGDEDVYLLGAVSLEELSLAADPLRRKLIPTEGLLLSTSGFAAPVPWLSFKTLVGGHRGG